MPPVSPFSSCLFVPLDAFAFWPLRPTGLIPFHGSYVSTQKNTPWSKSQFYRSQVREITFYIWGTLSSFAPHILARSQGRTGVSSLRSVLQGIFSRIQGKSPSPNLQASVLLTRSRKKLSAALNCLSEQLLRSRNHIYKTTLYAGRYLSSFW